MARDPFLMSKSKNPQLPLGGMDSLPPTKSKSSPVTSGPTPEQGPSHVSRGQFGQQLAMFMHPDEIMDAYHPALGDVYMGETQQGPTADNNIRWNYEDTWDRKYDEAVNSGLEASINGSPFIDKPGEGVVTPVQLFNGLSHDGVHRSYVANGNHRVAAASPEILIPVIHQSSKKEVTATNNVTDQNKNSHYLAQDAEDERNSDLDDSVSPWVSEVSEPPPGERVNRWGYKY